MEDLVTGLLGAGGRLGARWQPVVDVQTTVPVGWQPLLAAERNGAAVALDDLFSAARDKGVLDQLDEQAWTTALAGVGAWLGDSRLFLKVDPDSVQQAAAALVGLLRAPGSSLVPEQVVLDVVLRSDASDVRLAGLSAGCRRAGFRLCLAGVADEEVAARFVEYADVIKLSPDLLGPDEAATAGLAAVVGVAREADVVSLAFGVETPAHAARARGAQVAWGQGWFYGRPETR